MDKELLRTEITRALNLWSRHSKLAFREVSDKKADILISFEKRDHGDNLNFDGPGGVLAHAFFPASDIGGDAHFDSDEYWTGITTKSDKPGKILLNNKVKKSFYYICSTSFRNGTFVWRCCP